MALEINLNNKMQRENSSSVTMTLTQIVLQRGNQILYLVLKKKPFVDEIIDEVRDNIKQRLNEYLVRIIPKLQNIEFKNSEQSLKVIILNVIMKILKQMINEDIIKLDENDLMLLYNIIKDEEMKFVEDEKISKNNNNDIKKQENNQNNENNEKKGFLNRFWSFFNI